MDENKQNNPETKSNENTFKSVVSNTQATYSSFENSNQKQKKQKKQKVKSSNSGAGFGKTVLLPFACGILGAGLVVGTCFGVPNIRENLFSGFTVQEGSSTSNTVNLNTEQISLLDYSDTAVGVAQKVLPSIVGINVTYSVNSPFYGA